MKKKQKIKNERLPIAIGTNLFSGAQRKDPKKM
jgi:hypothetical protein